MKKKLKIAMFFSSDPSQAGGVQEHVFHLSRQLSKLGHKIDIYGPEKNILPYINYHPISKSVTVPVPNGNWANFTVKKSKINLTEMLKEKKYDLVHVHEPYIPFINWELMTESTIPKVATFHTGWDDGSVIGVFNPFISLFRNTFSSNFKGGIFVSKISKKRWRDLFAKKILNEVIHNGIDEIFLPLKNKKTGKIIKLLFLGRIVSRKGLIYLIKAVNNLSKKRKDFHLTIVGEGPLKKKLESYVRLHKLQKFVAFAGEIIGQKRVKYYQQANIFCAPYRDEAFGLTVLEAMATGTPIVGFKNSAFKEILKGYPYPELLVRSKDIDKLAGALEKIIKDKNMRQKTSSWLLKESKKYSWEKIAKETEEFYYKILEKT